MKKIIFFVFLALLVGSVVLLLGTLGGNGTPDSATSTATTTEEDEGEDVVLPGNLRNLNIEAGEEIDSPVVITGEARLWYFEASFPIAILDANKRVLAEGPAQAQDDWMTEEFVPFRAELTFSVSEDQRGWIRFRNDNPSGLPENQEEFLLPVMLERSNDMAVEVYFSPSQGGSGPFDCSIVKRVERTVPRTDAPARRALELLIEGPWEHEFEYAAIIPGDVEINSLSIENGTARVDFSRELNRIAGSCAVTAARAQIEETLKQFSTVDRVVISVEGSEDEALQP